MIKQMKKVTHQVKSKSALVQDMKQIQRVKAQKKLIRALLEKTQEHTVENLNDHLNVLSGLILGGIKNQTSKMTVGSLGIETKVKDSPSPKLIAEMHAIIADEKDPEEISALLAKLAQHLHQYWSVRCMKDKKVSDIKIEEIIA